MSLARFNGVAILANGMVAAAAPITVKRESDGTLASIFSDVTGLSAIAQPGFVTNADGTFTFCAAGSDGGYRIQITSGAETVDMRNVSVGVAAQRDASAYGAQLMAAADAPGARSVLAAAMADLFGVAQNLSLAFSVNANALTIALKDAAGNNPSASSPVHVPFRSATAATGTFARTEVNAATSLVVSSGSALGAANGVPFRLWIVGFLDGATFRLGVINCLSGVDIYPLAGWGVASSTAEGGAGAADSAHVFYTGAAVASKPYVVLGYAVWETGLAAAGTWNALPTRVQLFGTGVPLPGQRVQLRRTDTGAAATTTAVMPYDDTIPQNTEGAQFMSQAITPSSAANVLRVKAQAAHRCSAGGTAVSGALFKDNDANALAASAVTPDGTGVPISILTVDTVRRAGGTAAQTFKYRAGGSAVATVAFNADTSGTRRFGGVSNSYIEVEEMAA